MRPGAQQCLAPSLSPLYSRGGGGESGICYNKDDYRSCKEKRESEMSCIRHMSRIGGMLLFLGLGGVLLPACSPGSSSQTQPAGANPAFHTTLKTSDGLFLLHFSVYPERFGFNRFRGNG